MPFELDGQHAAGGNVVAVAEPARNREHLVVVQQLGPLGQAAYVHALGRGAGHLPGELGLGVAVCSRRSKNQNAYPGHEHLSRQSTFSDRRSG